MEKEDNEESRKRPFEEAANNNDSHHHHHHHHHSDAKKPTQDDIPLLKLLVPNYVAGALIGKGGAEMTEMQEKFGGTIKLSSSKDFYPGTSERIVVLTGEMNEIISLSDFIMEKLVTGEKKPKDDERTEQVKIVLTNGAAGLLIGRGGATIKAIQEETKAKINITKRDEVGVVMGERVLTMSGSMEQRLNACRKVIEIVALEPSNTRNNIIKYTQAVGVGNVLTPAGANTIYIAPYDLGINSSGKVASYGGGGGGVTKAQCRYKTNVHITMAVPDTMVGALLGKQGVTMREMTSYSGARIKFSEKNEFAPGTTDRVLNIFGDVGQTDTALLLINQKIEQVHQQYGNEYDY